LKILKITKHTLTHPVLREASTLFLGYDITRAGDRFESFFQNHPTLKKIFDLLITDPTYLWLYQNRLERMDATLDIYDEKRRKFHLDRYMFASKHVKNKTVADIACGTGYGTEILMNEGKADAVLGIDISPETIVYAKKNHMQRGVSFICQPGEDTQITSESLDVIISFETIEHVEDDKSLLTEFSRILKENGLLICSTPNNWPLEAAPYHKRVYNKDSFLALLSTFFNNIELYNQNSGSDIPFNHSQPAGITKTTKENQDNAECYIAVCKQKP
jgi:2-polyprenyl-3-methyl-5-hydroxy-6-metoxy-1,4-benzoquinol methylase